MKAMLRTSLLLIFSWGTLTGCSSVIAFQDQARDKSAIAADIALDHGVWSVCKAPSRGALVRRYQTEEQMQTHNNFCNMEAGRGTEAGIEAE